jgi:hypothetical protein
MIHLQNVGGRGKDVILKFTIRMGYEGEGMYLSQGVERYCTSKLELGLYFQPEG